ncbi:MAG: hypothetical protein RLZZ555_202 [Pseudomonadota bacterium]|jgi:type IV pilus assembly protein PilY1
MLHSLIRSMAGSLTRSGRAARWLLAGLLATGALSHADDTEIFRSTYDGSTSRPKVLIVFDDSGSMDTLVDVPKPRYDPSITYPAVGGIVSGRLYWATGTTGNPPPTSTSQWFYATRNRCASSYGPLSNQGYFIDQFGRWNTSISTSWLTTLSTSSKDPLHVECSDDVDGSNPGNGSGTGAPGNGYPRSSTPRPYGSDRQTSVDDRWNTYRIYSANYMNWYYSTTLGVDRTRLDIAQEVIASLVQANPGIDFGLEVFNSNYDSPFNPDGAGAGSSSYDGGRIVQRIIDKMSATDRVNLVGLIDSLRSEGSTPLCESFYEAYRYLSGQSVLYGLERPTSDVPARDPSAESSGQYLSPVGACQNVYIVLMTDGEPELDTDANARIESLTGKTCGYYADSSSTSKETEKNCLPELAEYLYTKDLDGNASNGTQKAVTYTIGFATDQKLLKDTASKGGGLYYTADSAETLAAAFQGAITSILSKTASFASPAVAVNNYTRTESRNEAYYAMFLPQAGTNWPGNIKKLSIGVSGSTASLLDSKGARAINSASGQIEDSAQTYWSTSVDGPDVKKGGVGALLLERLKPSASKDDRKVLSNTGSGGALQEFNTSNLSYSAFGLSDSTSLFSLFGVSDQEDFDDLIAWARGWTDSTRTERRDWILGDILHSRPLVLDYGARPGFSAANPDLRLLAGTNAGFLHMFRNDDGGEAWAFFPKELAPVINVRRNDVVGASPVYGVDSPPVVYRKDVNNDGKINPRDGDRMWVFFGLGRGGKSYYALDVTDPDSPVFMWRIDNSKSGFGELGQTWASPLVTTVPGYSAAGGTAKPVLVFGAGYDLANDDHGTTAATVSDTEGRGVFIVDAETGDLIWSVTPAAASTTNRQEIGLLNSVTAAVKGLDSNGDGRTDRLYAPDLGGNVWRIDLSGADRRNWRIVKLAQLAESGHAGDRRFFNAVEVVPTRYAGKDFDAVLVGSGDRSNPMATDNVDRFYMLRDTQILPYGKDQPTVSECSAKPSLDPRCQLPLTQAVLYDATRDLIQVGSEAERSAARVALGNASGWFIDLKAGEGEKSLSSSLTLYGTVYFTTFSPDTSTQAASVCDPRPGIGRLYAVGLADAISTRDFNLDSQLTLVDRSTVIGDLIPDKPATYFGTDRIIRLLTSAGNPRNVPGGLRRAIPTHWYDQEF